MGGGFINPWPGESGLCPTPWRPREPLLSLEFPLLLVSDGGGLILRTKVGELSELAVSGAELSMLAMWCPGVLGLLTLRLAHLNLASQALLLSSGPAGW